MIRLFNIYKIEADSRCFILQKESSILEDETITYTTLGYYSTITDCLIGLSRHMKLDECKKNIHTINSYLTECRKIDSRLETIIKSIDGVLKHNDFNDIDVEVKNV